MSHFIPNTPAERRAMLDSIGIKDFSELVSNIPKELRQKAASNLGAPLSETEILGYFEKLAQANQTDLNSFLGGGIYDHFIPASVDQIMLRSEFYTAYTPYQAELSQGTLQALFEFQSMVCELAGTEVANASLYDGATAMVEAVAMARAIAKNRGNRLLVSTLINPRYLEVLKTYNIGFGIDIVPVGFNEHGGIDLNALEKCIKDDCFALVMGQPNFAGVIEDVPAVRTAIGNGSAVLIVINNLLSSALIEPPGLSGADIVAGEMHYFGMPPQCGGPLLGYLGAKRANIRSMPGRIVGETIDADGRRAFVLTAQTREQHIRRERATSNICTAEVLCAIGAAIYMSLTGKKGIRDIAKLCVQKAHYLSQSLAEITGVELKFSSPFFNEFVLVFEERLYKKVVSQAHKNGIIPGLELASLLGRGFKNSLLVCVTEKKSMKDLNDYVDFVKAGSAE